jgi:hypothetical protein
MDIVLILSTNYPGKEWSLIGNPENELQYEQSITWISKGSKPSWADLEAAWPDVEYNTAYNAVSATRLAAYATTSDPVFFQWQRGEKTEQQWLDAVIAVNEANPYPLKPI